MKAEYPIAIAVRLTPEQAKWVRREAEDREVWVSDIIRELIEAKRPA